VLDGLVALGSDHVIVPPCPEIAHPAVSSRTGSSRPSTGRVRLSRRERELWHDLERRLRDRRSGGTAS